MKLLSGFRQFDRPVHPVEQRHAQLVLESSNGVGHRRLSHSELTGGACEVLMPAGCLEDDEACGRRK